MSERLRPAAGWELQNMLGQYVEHGHAVAITGSGSKATVGRPMSCGVELTTSSMRGIWLYEPAELVMSAQAGTPIAQVEAELAANGQMLAFEPIDLGPATGGVPGVGSIGASFATNLSGARRIKAGAARDHLLGIEAVNGRAELFRAGGRVMKNVAGYDLCRAMCGSWGTLAVMTEVTFKVMPFPEDTVTLVYPGLPDDIAVEVMCAGMRLPFEISGAVHLQAGLVERLENEGLARAKQSLTFLRIENFASSVAYRKDAIKEQLKVYGQPLEIDMVTSLALWSELRRLSVLPYRADSFLWRISTAPTKAPEIVAAISRHMPAQVMYDWSGGLIWVEVQASADAGASDIRRAVAVHGGHATLIRAEESVRRSVEVFQPQVPGIERLLRGLKNVFDPRGIFNPGRMYASM